MYQSNQPRDEKEIPSLLPAVGKAPRPASPGTQNPSNRPLSLSHDLSPAASITIWYQRSGPDLPTLLPLLRRPCSPPRRPWLALVHPSRRQFSIPP